MRNALSVLSFVLLALPSVVAAAPREAVPIWPANPPGPVNTTAAEADTSKPDDHKVDGRPLLRIGNVSRPSLTFYPAPADKNSGATVLVFPGGAYRILALDLEGTEICDWLNSIGVNAVLVKYRVPEPEGIPRYQEPLQDAQRALGLVRQHASEWRIDPHKVGVLGFSAGGNLAAQISNNFDKRTYDRVDAADDLSCRPDFAILIYPAYLVTPPQGPALSPELHVTAQTPPTFILQTEDDPVHMENSLFYDLALKQANVPAELHLFPSGGHGYGLRPSEHAVSHWPVLAEAWLRSLGMLGQKRT